MARLEEIVRGATVKGILPDGLVTIIDIAWHGSTAVTVTYKDASGRVAQEILLREREPNLELVSAGQP